MYSLQIFWGILYPTDVRNRGFTMALYPIFARALAVFWLILSWRFILAPCVLWHTFNWRLSDSGTPCPVSTLITAWRGILAHAVRRGVGSTSDTKGSIELWARRIRDKIQMFNNTNRTKYNRRRQNTNRTKCKRTKYKHDRIQKNKIQIAKIQM